MKLLLLTALILIAIFNEASACNKAPGHTNYQVILLGPKGAGKSALGLGLLGYQGYQKHPWSMGNGCLEPSDQPGEHSHTTEPCRVSGNLFYYEYYYSITIIDTPGFETDGASNARNIKKTVDFLTREVKQATIFMVMMKYGGNEWDLILNSLEIYEMYFGPEFWNHVVFGFNFVPHYGYDNYIQEYWRDHVNKRVKHPKKLLTVFVNPLETTSQLRAQVDPMLRVVYQLPNMDLYNIEALIAKVAEMKAQKDEESTKALEIIQETTATTTIISTTTPIPFTSRPLICARTGQPIVIRGRTIYDDDEIYTVMDVFFAGFVGFGACLGFSFLLILCSHFCCCKKKEKKQEMYIGGYMPYIGSKSSKVSFKLKSGKKPSKLGEKEERKLSTIYQGKESMNELDETMSLLDLTIPVKAAKKEPSIIDSQNDDKKSVSICPSIEIQVSESNFV